MDALFCRPLLVLLAGALPALLIVALTLCAVPAAATEYGANAPIPFVLLPPDNPWNTRVDTLPLDPNSADCIAHMAPKASTVSLPATAIMREGDEWTVGGSFIDESGSAWSATVDYCARREPLELGAHRTFEAVHTWLDDGAYRVPVTVTSDLARSAGAGVAVGVVNVAPRVRAGGKANVAAGAPLTRHGSFADPGADTWTGAVDWGDGSARTALRLRADKTFTLAHRFPRVHGGGYAVVVTVRDDDGGRGPARFRVTVR